MLSTFLYGTKINIFGFIPKLFAYDTLRSSMIVEKNDRLLSDLHACIEDGLDIEVENFDSVAQNLIDEKIKSNPKMFALDTQDSNSLIIRAYIQHMSAELNLMDFVLFRKTGIPCFLLINKNKIRRPEISKSFISEMSEKSKKIDSKEKFEEFQRCMQEFRDRSVFSQSTESFIGTFENAYIMKDKGLTAVIETNDSKWRLFMRLFFAECLLEFTLINIPFVKTQIMTPFLIQFSDYLPIMLTNILSGLLQIDFRSKK